MKVTLWGTRGSIAAPGPETVRYGGNTSCVEIRGADGRLLVIDAGTGIQRLSATISHDEARVDLLLSHLHMDHIQGLGFFKPLFEPGLDVHIWGPASTTQDLRARLARYLSPPLFPVLLRELPCKLTLHDVPFRPFKIGPFRLESSLVCHPGPTVGYRIRENSTVITYLSDHEPALGVRRFPEEPAWTSGFKLARHCDLLIHDTQYTSDEYPDRLGWGHSTVEQAVAFARLTGARRLLTFHHDPAHSDAQLDEVVAQGRRAAGGALEVIGGMEGMRLPLGE